MSTVPFLPSRDPVVSCSASCNMSTRFVESLNGDNVALVSLSLLEIKDEFSNWKVKENEKNKSQSISGFYEHNDLHLLSTDRKRDRQNPVIFA